MPVFQYLQNLRKPCENSSPPGEYLSRHRRAETTRASKHIAGFHEIDIGGASIPNLFVGSGIEALPPGPEAPGIFQGVQFAGLRAPAPAAMGVHFPGLSVEDEDQ